jgi:hypothetical protein
LPDEKDIALAIVAYLRDHPHAMDTPEGIAQWWLGDLHPPVAAPVLERALNALVESQQLEAVELKGSTGYRLPRGTL